MEYLAHISSDGERKQTLVDHLLGTANLCEKFAQSFMTGTIPFAIGLCHDAGKVQEAFQRRLKGSPIRCDHSTPSAKWIRDKTGMVFAATVIAGHHSGLPDIGTKYQAEGSSTLSSRMKMQEPKEMEIWQKIVEETDWKFPKSEEWRKEILTYLSNPKNQDLSRWQISFLTRMLFSCLVDADYLDTERFMLDGFERSGTNNSLSDLNEIFNSYVENTFQPDSNPLNIMRTKIRKKCEDAANYPQGVFTLTVPTGGGKTISSLSFALKHAVKHRMERIIYVISYTSIIDQTAKLLRKIFPENTILEHHHNVVLEVSEGEANDRGQQSLKLATENWDIPIIVTTSVQFFESFHSNKSSQCRKLHNVANSVVIFDEAQLIPISYMRPCLATILELAKNYKTSAVFCTATQPGFKEFIANDMLAGISDKEIPELCPLEKKDFEVFKRCRFHLEKESYTHEQLANEIMKHEQCLCIVNTRKDAKKLYRFFGQERFVSFVHADDTLRSG